MDNDTNAAASSIAGAIGSQVEIARCGCVAGGHARMIGNVVETNPSHAGCGCSARWVVEEANPYSSEAPRVCRNVEGIEGRGWAKRRVHGSHSLA